VLDGKVPGVKTRYRGEERKVDAVGAQVGGLDLRQDVWVDAEHAGRVAHVRVVALVNLLLCERVPGALEPAKPSTRSSGAVWDSHQCVC
jgi:hypothetical protein